MAAKAALPKLKMTTETFTQVYQMGCPRAVGQMLNIGMLEPIWSEGGQAVDVAVKVAKTVQHFVTTMVLLVTIAFVLAILDDKLLLYMDTL